MSYKTTVSDFSYPLVIHATDLAARESEFASPSVDASLDLISLSLLLLSSNKVIMISLD